MRSVGHALSIWALYNLDLVASATIGSPAITERAAPVELPVVKLPYGSWRASAYDSKNDIYTFKNIRFAAPPTGSRRFAKPVDPEPVNGVQDSKNGRNCWQFPAPVINNLATSLGNIAERTVNRNADEDCLFLEVTVPGKVFKNNVSNLPVVDYIYGGAYVMGTKDGTPAYTGVPIVRASQGNVVAVIANYRVGPLGFAIGAEAIKQNATNLGLHDQRFALEWIQKHISSFGGDPSKVTVQGTSAGGGSILHHLVQYGGERDPLFKRAIIHSAAAQFTLDIADASKERWTRFLRESKCIVYGFECLQKIPVSEMVTAVSNVDKAWKDGTWGFGPVTDGQWLKDIAILEFKKGNYWKDVDIMISHMKNEGGMFAPKVQSEVDVDGYFGNLFRYAESAIAPIRSRYQLIPGPQDRANRIATDYNFLCLIPPVIKAYNNRTWFYQHTRGTATHGQDLPVVFNNPDVGGNFISSFSTSSDRDFQSFANTLQSWYARFATRGDPNAGSGASFWPKVISRGYAYGNVMNAGNNGFQIVDNNFISLEICDAWSSAAETISAKNRRS